MKLELHNGFFRFLIVLGLTAAAVAGCQLLQPSQTSPPRIDNAVEVPVGDSGATVTVGTEGATERPSTVADDAIDTVATVGGTVTGNPLLWGLAAQLGHLVVGMFAGRRKQEQPA